MDIQHLVNDHHPLPEEGVEDPTMGLPEFFPNPFPSPLHFPYSPGPPPLSKEEEQQQAWAPAPFDWTTDPGEPQYAASPVEPFHPRHPLYEVGGGDERLEEAKVRYNELVHTYVALEYELSRLRSIIEAGFSEPPIRPAYSQTIDD